jgi:hypothetical protein
MSYVDYSVKLMFSGQLKPRQNLDVSSVVLAGKFKEKGKCLI